jgi:hypothetical protein
VWGERGGEETFLQGVETKKKDKNSTNQHATATRKKHRILSADDLYLQSFKNPHYRSSLLINQLWITAIAVRKIHMKTRVK